jgi:hypothetical protein
MVQQLCFMLTRHWDVIDGWTALVVYTHSIFYGAVVGGAGMSREPVDGRGTLLVYIRGGIKCQSDVGSLISFASSDFALVGGVQRGAIRSMPPEMPLMFPVIVGVGRGVWVGVACGPGWEVTCCLVPVALLCNLLAFRRCTNHYRACMQRQGGDEVSFWCLAFIHILCLQHLAITAVGWADGAFASIQQRSAGRLRCWRVLLVIGVGYFLATRLCGGYWIWRFVDPCSPVLPVVPVLATPHSGYCPGLDFAIALAGAGLGGSTCGGGAW